MEDFFGPSGPFAELLTALVGSVVNWTKLTLLVVVYLVFLGFEAATLPRRLEAAFGPERAAHVMEVGQRTNAAIIEYVYVKGLTSLLVAGLSTVAMLSFDLDLAVLWGTIIFFGNFIPYVGSAVAILFPITIGVLQFDAPTPMIALAAILLLLQVLIGNFLDPHFAGRELNLTPLAVLLSLAFWGWICEDEEGDERQCDEGEGGCYSRQRVGISWS